MAERDSGQPESAEGPGPPGREVGATSFLQRAVVRRRVRFLHRRRELALYDLGGFLFESHRLGAPHAEILSEKLEALTALDDELALLQRALGLHEEVAVLSEPGIAACSHCGTLRDSAANFCPGCGRPAAETMPHAAPATSQHEVVIAAVPEVTAEMPAADISAGHDSEIAAAEPAQDFQAPPGPDATAATPAAEFSAGQDSEIAAAEPAQDFQAPAGPDATAEMPAAEFSAGQDSEIAALEPALEPRAAAGADATAAAANPPAVEVAEIAAGPAGEHAVEPARNAGSGGQADEASAAAADAPS